MEALIRAARAENYPAKIVLVISNKQGVGGLEKAKKHGIKTICIDHKNYSSRKSFEKVMDKVLRQHQIELICNAGFMRILSPWFVERWRGRQLNIHPSLLPKYKGLNTHARVLKSGETEHGCTVHFIDEGMDTGDIIAQAKIPVHKNDTPRTLAARVLAQEHLLYPKVLRQIAKNVLEP